MHYMLLLIGEEPNWEEFTPEEMQTSLDAMNVFNDELKGADAWVTGAGLETRDTATVIRFPVEGDVAVTDGPFIETKEQLMGFWILECADLDAALGWAKKTPLAGSGSSVEVRPLIGEDEELDGAELLKRASGQSS